MLGKDAEMRKQINQIVRDYAQSHGGCYEAAWNRIYRELNKRHHIYVKARARHRKVRPLDIAEAMGLIPSLVAISASVFA